MSDAVHVPPGSDAPVPRPPEPSGIPRTLGVLSIVFGGLVALRSLAHVVLAGRPFLFARQQAIPDHVLELTRRLAPYTQTVGGMMLIMSVALLIIWIGPYGYRAAARQP